MTVERQKLHTVGVVGAGQIVQAVHLPVLLNLPGARVAWVTDADDVRAAETARAFGVPHLRFPRSVADLSSCDVALLAIPLDGRKEYFREFARRGTAVLAEKPLAVGSDRHLRLLEEFPAERLGCGYQRRFYRNNIGLRRLVTERPFGRLLRIRLCEGARTTQTGFDSTQQDRSYEDGGGILLAIGCHGIDLAVDLVRAVRFRVLDNRMIWDGRTDRRVEARLELTPEEGEPLEFELCVSWLDHQENTVELEFEHAVVCTGIQVGSPIRLRARNAASVTATLIPLDAGAETTNQAFFLEWQDFLRGLEAGRPSRIAASSSLLTTRIIEELATIGASP